MEQIVTGETEAKAILKGKLRKIQSKGDDILRKREKSIYCRVKKSSKIVNEFFKDELAFYGDFLVTNKKFKCFGGGSTKHWKSEFTAIEPDLIHAKDIGLMSKFILGYFDSRKYCKGDLTGFTILSSQFYFHEHFLIRCIQRFNKRSIGEIGSIIYPVIEWLITENIPLSRINDTNYFVFKDFIFVADKLPNSRGLIFKTVLLTNKLTNEDEKKFSSSLELLSNSKQESVKVVMTNETGQVVRKIPTSVGKSLLNSLTKKSFWVQHILTAPDIRGNHETLLEKLTSTR